MFTTHTMQCPVGEGRGSVGENPQDGEYWSKNDLPAQETRAVAYLFVITRYEEEHKEGEGGEIGPSEYSRGRAGEWQVRPEN